MYFKTFIAAATTLAVLCPTVLAESNAIMKNQYNKAIQIISVVKSASSEPTEIQINSKYFKIFCESGNGSNISIKLSFNSSLDNISQFKYTLTLLQDMIFYNLFNINSYLFQKSGATIKSSNDSCNTVICKADIIQCKNIYNQSFNNHIIKSCAIDTDLTLTLCPSSNCSKTKHASHPHFFQM